MKISEQKEYFQSKDGLRLVGIWHLPEKQTDTAIILAHGITVDKDEDGIFINLADCLKENGFTVFRFDFRGHGESEGKQIDMTIHGEIMDLESSVNNVVEKGYKQIGLLGASFGGSITVLYTAKNQNKIKALCMWNPCLNYDHCFINPYLPWLVKRKKQMKIEIETQGKTTIGSRKYVVGKKLWEEMKTLFPYKELQKVRIPAVILHDRGDNYVPYEDSKKYIQGIGRLITMKGGGHGFQRPPYDKEAIRATLSFFQNNF